MGRELKRVALTFDWPIGEVWRGFLNPHRKPCPEEARGLCHAGSTCGGMWLDAVCRFLALLGKAAVDEPRADELRRRGQTFPHPYLQEFPQAPRTGVPREVHERLRDVEDQRERFAALARYLQAHPPQVLPFTEEVARLVTGLASGKRPDGGLLGNAHQVQWEIQKTLLRVAGIDPEGGFGVCPVCKGKAIDPAAKEAYEAWEPEQPPAGEGWQLWETVSEGSPVSKVYPTREAFEDYLVAEGYSREAAHAFCDAGWAPSAVIAGGKMYRDVESSVLK